MRVTALAGLLGLVACALAQQQVCNTKADIVFIMDGSGSIGGQNFLTQLDFIKDIVNQFPVGPNDVQFGLLKFSTFTEVEFTLNKYANKQDILNKLNLIYYYGGGTKIGMALTEAKQKMFTPSSGRRSGVPTIAMVITDGRSTDSVVTPAYNLRTDYVEVFSIGVGNQANQPELQEMASRPANGHVFMVNNYNQLKDIAKKIVKVSCEAKTLPTTNTPVPTRPSLTFTDAPTTQAPPTKPPTTQPPPTKPPTTQPPPTKPPTTQPPPTKPPTQPPGPTKTPTKDQNSPVGPTKTAGPTKPPRTPVVTVAPGKTTSNPVRPTNSPQPGKVVCADDKVDIVFCLDSSGSISIANWNVLKNFVGSMVQGFNLGPDKTRVAALRFSDGVTDQFQLKDSARMGMGKTLNQIQLMQYDGAGTKTHLAIKHMRTVSFTPGNGARAGVPKVAIIISDGNSNEPHTTEKEANELKKMGVLVFAIGVGDKITQDELRRMASDPKGNYVFTVSTFKDLSNIRSQLNSQTCGKVKEPFTGTFFPTVAITTPGGCRDVNPDCGRMNADICTDYEPWARQNCAATCKFCVGAVTQTPGQCFDARADCSAYGNVICTDRTYREFAQTNCPCFCKFCSCAPKTTTTPKPTTTVATPCVNKDANCELYDSNICTDPGYKSWAAINCRAHCKFCTPTATQGQPCVDALSVCKDYGSNICTDMGYRPWAKQNCRKFCNLC